MFFQSSNFIRSSTLYSPSSCIPDSSCRKEHFLSVPIVYPSRSTIPLIDASRYLEDDSIVNGEWELIALGRERYREQQDRQLEDTLIGRGDIGKEGKEKEGQKGERFAGRGGSERETLGVFVAREICLFSVASYMSSARNYIRFMDSRVFATFNVGALA